MSIVTVEEAAVPTVTETTGLVEVKGNDHPVPLPPTETVVATLRPVPTFTRQFSFGVRRAAALYILDHLEEYDARAVTVEDGQQPLAYVDTEIGELYLPTVDKSTDGEDTANVIVILSGEAAHEVCTAFLDAIKRQERAEMQAGPTADRLIRHADPNIRRDAGEHLVLKYDETDGVYVHTYVDNPDDLATEYPGCRWLQTRINGRIVFAPFSLIVEALEWANALAEEKKTWTRPAEYRYCPEVLAEAAHLLQQEMADGTQIKNNIRTVQDAWNECAPHEQFLFVGQGTIVVALGEVVSKAIRNAVETVTKHERRQLELEAEAARVAATGNGRRPKSRSGFRGHEEEENCPHHVGGSEAKGQNRRPGQRGARN